ncbi:Multidrug/pheromone exporter, ABC superfamily [Phaffia rhodozyma]|uniref:Multidrug/pheromone exporter, ABC superfamily n=1 Tax=Phaffia rhodozyma TaxID=264483 RepID=A0A0F7SKK6_PHARH|nr:Multidrug/pheromone exporter, ABC superfamily [Phaffia rhodozyma]
MPMVTAPAIGSSQSQDRYALQAADELVKQRQYASIIKNVPELKKFEPLPGVLYFLSYATRADLILYALGLVGSLCCALPTILVDYMYGQWTSGLVQNGRTGSPEEIRMVSRFTALIMLATGLGFWVFSSVFFGCFALASSRMCARIRIAYISSVTAQDSARFESVGAGEVGSRLAKGIRCLQIGIREILGFLLWSIGTICSSLVMAFKVSPQVGGVLFGIFPFAGILPYLSTEFSSRPFAKISRMEGHAALFLEQVLSTVRIVKVLQASDTLVSVYDSYLRKIEKDGNIVVLSKGFAFSTACFSVFAAYALCFYRGGVRVAYHGLSSGNLFTSFFSTYSAIFAVISILSHLTMLHEAFAAQAQVRAEIERISEIDYQNPAGLTTLPSVNLGIKRGHYNKVSKKLTAGKVTAFVGASGSGKFTLVALMATVLQDPALFAGSILDNVAICLTGTPDEYAADRKNEARLPEGLDTMINGMKTGLLSGGQRQRQWLAVARALVRRSNLLILERVPKSTSDLSLKTRTS